MTTQKDINADATLRVGAQMHGAGKIAEAESLYREVLERQPRHPHAMYLLGVAALQTNRPALAAELIGRALRLSPGDAHAHLNHGLALNQLGHYSAAIQSFNAAISASPGNGDAYEHRGHAQRGLGSWQCAVDDYGRALALGPERMDARIGRGTAFYYLRRFEQAIADFDAAIAINPREPAAYNNRGNILRELKKATAAVADYDRAIALYPEFADAYFNRGHALRETQQYEAAIASYDTAVTLKPEIRQASTFALYTRMLICDWRAHAERTAALEKALASGEEAANPFFVLALSQSPLVHRQSAHTWSHEAFPANVALSNIAKHPRSAKIRLGYFSADFHDHATMRLMAELFELHDRTKFEVTAFSFGRDSSDPMRMRLRNACDHFFAVRSESDLAIVRSARERQIDIAIDLKGFTEDARPGIFALRAAPIQVSYLGYPGTLGAPYMDYLVADDTLIPRGSEAFYDEKILFLPHSYQVNDRRRPIAASVGARDSWGLPDDAFVFCCFNNTYKITPQVFGGWLRILQRVPRSVLWLFADNVVAARNLRAAARTGGVEPGRLIFAGNVAPAEHLARQRLADLFLDTLPYNAHTTASDALWAGLPVLTRIGDGFAGRVAASLLTSIGLPELITQSEQEYEDLAVALAGDRGRIAQLRQTLAENRLCYPLFDTPRFVRNFESGLTQIYERNQTDLPPAVVRVADQDPALRSMSAGGNPAR